MEDLKEQIEKLNRLMLTGEEANIKLALQLAKSQGIDIQHLKEIWLPLFRFMFKEENVNFINGINSIQKMGSIRSGSKGLESIPKDIHLMRSLIFIDLSCNKIKELPYNIGGLTSLKRLKLYSNEIQKIPETFYYLRELTELNLYNNKIESIGEGIKNLDKLVELDISSNKLTKLPDGLFDLPNLKILKISSNKLDSIPHKFHLLPKLTHLWCDRIQRKTADRDYFNSLKKSIYIKD